MNAVIFAVLLAALFLFSRLMVFHAFRAASLCFFFSFKSRHYDSMIGSSRVNAFLLQQTITLDFCVIHVKFIPHAYCFFAQSNSFKTIFVFQIVYDHAV